MKPKSGCGPKGPGNGMANRGGKNRRDRDEDDRKDNDLVDNLFPDGIPDNIPDGVVDEIADQVAVDPALSGILDGLDGVDLDTAGLDSIPDGKPKPPSTTAPQVLVDNSPVTAVQRVSSVRTARGITTHKALTGTGTTTRKRYVSE